MSADLSLLREALRDRYRLERELGAGGMATVYLAEDLKHHRQVAIKVLRPELAQTVVAERFLHEIQIIAGFSHPHILALHDSGAVDGLVYYVTPLVDGGSLRQRLDREGPLPVAEVLRLVHQVSDALSYAHERGVIHRDVKPDNILLQAGEALLADFGIARALLPDEAAPVTTAGFIVGTPAYMSPEQAGGDRIIDGRSDQFALACVAYELLGGEAAFSGRTPQAVLARQLARESGSLRSLRQSLPEAIDQVIRRALSPVPADRFPNVAAFASALEEAAKLPEPAWKRRRVRFVVAGVLALVAVVIAGWFLLPPRHRAFLATIARRPDAAIDPARIVIAPFENRTGDSTLANLGLLAADVVARGLATVGVGHVVDPRTAVFTSQLVNQLPAPLRRGSPTVALAREVGAGVVVSGSIYMILDTLRFEASVTNSQTGDLLRTVTPVNGSRKDLVALLNTLQQRVSAALAIEVDSVYGQWSAPFATPPSLEAYETTLKGLEAHFRWDNEVAYRLLGQAARMDTTYPTPVLINAYVRSVTADFPGLDSLLQSVASQRTRFNSGERLMYEALACHLEGDRVCTLDRTTALMELSPGSPEIPIWVARVATSLNRPRTAMAALERTDPERGLLLLNTAYWRRLAAAYHEMGEFEQELAASERGLAQFPANATPANSRVRALAALGREREIVALLHLYAEGRLSNVGWSPVADPRRGGEAGLDQGSAAEESQSEYALATLDAFAELGAHGHADAASRMADSLRALARRLSSGRALRVQLIRAQLLTAVGDWPAATRVFDTLGPPQVKRVDWLGVHGAAAAHAGHLGVAEAYADSLDRLSEPYEKGRRHYWRARIYAVGGLRDEAVAALDLAVRQGWSGWFERDGEFLHELPDFASLRTHPGFQALLAPLPAER